MKNQDIERYSLSDEDKATLRRMRNLRRNGRLNEQSRKRMVELMKNGKTK